MNKTKFAIWAIRNPRTRGLIIKGMKNRRVRGVADPGRSKGTHRTLSKAC